LAPAGRINSNERSKQAYRNAKKREQTALDLLGKTESTVYEATQEFKLPQNKPGYRGQRASRAIQSIAGATLEGAKAKVATSRVKASALLGRSSSASATSSSSASGSSNKKNLLLTKDENTKSSSSSFNTRETTTTTTKAPFFATSNVAAGKQQAQEEDNVVVVEPIVVEAVQQATTTTTTATVVVEASMEVGGTTTTTLEPVVVDIVEPVVVGESFFANVVVDNDDSMDASSVELVSDEDFDKTNFAKQAQVEKDIDNNDGNGSGNDNNEAAKLALRSADLAFFVVERVVKDGVPLAIENTQQVVGRIDNAYNGGQGTKGWKAIKNTKDPKRKY